MNNRPRSPAELDLIDQLEKLIRKLGETGNDAEILREMERLNASFEDSGKMLVTSKLNNSERKIFFVVDGSLTKIPTSETAVYLAYHREIRFQN